MVFVSSTIPFEKLEVLEESYPDLWFLFTSNVSNKNYRAKGNDKLDTAKWRLSLYKDFYTKIPLYCYLMTDNFYYKTKFFKSNPCLGEVFCMEKVPHGFSEMLNNPGKYQLISKEEQTITKQDIKQVFEVFKNNNFKENPFCEVIIGK